MAWCRQRLQPILTVSESAPAGSISLPRQRHGAGSATTQIATSPGLACSECSSCVTPWHGAGSTCSQVAAGAGVRRQRQGAGGTTTQGAASTRLDSSTPLLELVRVLGPPGIRALGMSAGDGGAVGLRQSGSLGYCVWPASRCCPPCN
jgi:hypothetical protein